MKLINIYQYRQRIFLIYKFLLKNGPHTMVEPVLEFDADQEDFLIGQGFLDVIRECGIIEKRPEVNVFGILLKKSRARSNKNLVKYGQLIRAIVNGCTIEFELQEARPTIKAFVASESPKQIKIEELSPSVIGQAIKALFNISQV